MLLSRIVLFLLALALPSSFADAQSPGGFVASVDSGQVSVGTTVTQLVRANQSRRGVLIIQEGTTAVRLGTAGVTTSNGYLLPGVANTTITVLGGGAIYGIVGTGTDAVSFLEMF